MKSFKYTSILWYINLILFTLVFSIRLHLTDTHHLSFQLTKSNGVVRRARALKINQHHEHHRWGPFFEESLNSTQTQNGEYVVQTAHLYTEAVLNCRVGMLKDKIVMWVKHSLDKVSLLTVGNVTYSGDKRISVKFQYPNNWRLLINPTQKDDEGIYMCQVSTHPPRAFFTNLTIIEPPIRIIDEEEREIGDRYYKSGSTIKLQCQVSRSFLIKANLCTTNNLKNACKITTNNENVKMNVNSIQNENKPFHNNSNNQKLYNISKANIFWTKDADMLPGTTAFNTSVSDKWLNTQFAIPDAKFSDSGNYTCSVGNIFSAIVQVQILTGELPAAVQHNGVYSLKKSKNINYWPRFLLFTLLQYMWNN